MKKFFLVLLFLSGPFLTASVTYSAKDYSYLIGMEGFNKELLEIHFKLYQGYVDQTNQLGKLLDGYLASGKKPDATYSALKRRVGWEFDGMRLHELYFENLGGTGVADIQSPLYQALKAQFGSFEAWKADFVATGLMRGIGWSILYYDTETKNLFNCWINEHDVGHLATAVPLLIMDVFEHAYMPQYGLNRAEYIQAFFKNINWEAVSQRYLFSVKKPLSKNLSPN